MNQQFLQILRQVVPIMEQYQQALEEEQKYQNARARKEGLEQQLTNYENNLRTFLSSTAAVPNPNNWPICPQTGLPYDPSTR